MHNYFLSHLRELEAEAIYVLREVYSQFQKPAILFSGGKDSLTVLSLVHQLSKENPKITISALAIDEGIKGYRDKTLITASDFCKKKNIPFHISF